MVSRTFTSGLRYSATDSLVYCTKRYLTDLSQLLLQLFFDLSPHWMIVLVSLTGINFGFVWYHSNVSLPNYGFLAIVSLQFLGNVSPRVESVISNISLH